MVEKSKKEEKDEVLMTPQLQELIEREEWTKIIKLCM